MAAAENTPKVKEVSSTPSIGSATDELASKLRRQQITLKVRGGGGLILAGWHPEGQLNSLS